ncbi:hypothetical protein Scep_008982 [Stephania cephalantha]|uniref:Uncharacterized protein n=1 Tax=Stephania cephalantha TaxID=152367 RepID=A0AAP0PFV6_9MAGN
MPRSIMPSSAFAPPSHEPHFGSTREPTLDSNLAARVYGGHVVVGCDHYYKEAKNIDCNEAAGMYGGVVFSNNYKRGVIDCDEAARMYGGLVFTDGTAKTV